MENHEFQKIRVKNLKIKLEDFDLDNISIDEKSHENISICDISYETLYWSKTFAYYIL